MMSESNKRFELSFMVDSTPGFLAWSQQKGQETEIGTLSSISNKTLMRATDKALIKSVETMIAHACANKLLQDSLIPLSLTIGQEHNPDLCVIDFIAKVDAVFYPFLMPYCFKLERELKETRRLLRLPLWKFIWRRLRKQKTPEEER